MTMGVSRAAMARASFSTPAFALVVTILLTACATPAANSPALPMPDGKLWTIRNLDHPTPTSYCYDNAAANCAKYGRLYTWAEAQTVCQTLGPGWRLPSNDEWRALATAYGGLYEEGEARGRAAYAALVAGGASGFEVLAGGARTPAGEFARGDDHGFFWTATETGPDTAWLYNFGRNAGFVNRHANMEKARAASVRCIKD